MFDLFRGVLLLPAITIQKSENQYTYNILSQKLTLENTRKILRKFKVLVEVLLMGDKIIDLSLESDFKDVKTSKIPVLTAKDYI